MHHQQTEEVADIQKSYQWLDKAGVKDRTEALIMATQERALSTRATLGSTTVTDTVIPSGSNIRKMEYEKLKIYHPRIHTHLYMYTKLRQLQGPVVYSQVLEIG